MDARDKEKSGWKILVLLIAGLLITLSFIYPERGWPEEVPLGEVVLAWDANTEENLAGYKIYYGKVSRYDSVVAMGVPAAIALGCNLPESGELTEVQQKCKDSWEKYCSCIEWQSDGADPPVYTCKTAPNPPDPACDSDYFKYEGSVDVKNVTEYTLKLPDGMYYLAATAYNDKYPARNNESKFSKELVHRIVGGAPGKMINFRKLKNIEKEGK